MKDTGLAFLQTMKAGVTAIQPAKPSETHLDLAPIYLLCVCYAKKKLAEDAKSVLEITAHDNLDAFNSNRTAALGLGSIERNIG